MRTIVRYSMVERGDKMSIGLNIKKRREQLGLTQEQLAKKMGYKSKSTINKVELGINDVPQRNIIKFAHALNVDVNYLMGWDKEKETELLNIFNSLSDKGKDRLIDLAKDLLDIYSQNK